MLYLREDQYRGNIPIAMTDNYNLINAIAKVNGAEKIFNKTFTEQVREDLVCIFIGRNSARDIRAACGMFCYLYEPKTWDLEVATIDKLPSGLSDFRKKDLLEETVCECDSPDGFVIADATGISHRYLSRLSNDYSDLIAKTSGQHRKELEIAQEYLERLLVPIMFCRKSALGIIRDREVIPPIEEDIMYDANTSEQKKLSYSTMFGVVPRPIMGIG